MYLVCRNEALHVVYFRYGLIHELHKQGKTIIRFEKRVNVCLEKQMKMKFILNQQIILLTFSRAISSFNSLASIRSTAPFVIFLPMASSLAHSYPSIISSTFANVSCTFSSSPSPSSSVSVAPTIKRSTAAWFDGSKYEMRALWSLRLATTSSGVEGSSLWRVRLRDIKEGVGELVRLGKRDLVIDSCGATLQKCKQLCQETYKVGC